MTTQTSDAERQLDWEARTGWLYEEGKSLDRGVVSWITGRRQSAADTWPQLTAWDHARPVEHVETGERAYLLMPYGLADSAAAQLDLWCQARGLRYEVLVGEGWWHPGTVAVLVRCDYDSA